VRGLSRGVKTFVIVFAPVAVAIVGFSTRPSHPITGYCLLVIAGLWMVGGVALRDRRESSG
jgi:hypothetical protein